MPMYEYQCVSCETRTEAFRRIADRMVPFDCDCGGVFEQKIFTAPSATVQEECHYVCPATGDKITSWRQRRNQFAEKGLTAIDPDQHQEKKQKQLKKKAKRDELAENYLPKDLHTQIKSMGQEQGFVG